MASNNTSYSALKTEKQYLKLIFATMISRFGDALDAIAFSWITFQVTGSAAAMAVIFGINCVPSVIFQPFAGVFVERWSKKRVMVLCDLGRGAIVLSTVWLMSQNALSFAVLAVFTFANSTLEAFREPAATAIVPKILLSENYTVGTALKSALTRVMEIVGMACAGGIIGLFGAGTALAIDALTFLASAIIIFLIKYQENTLKAAFEVKEYLSSLKAGFSYIKNDKLLVAIIFVGLLMNAMIIPLNVFETVFVVDTLKMGPETLSAIGICLSGGMAAGALLFPKLQKHFKNNVLLILMGMMVSIFMGVFSQTGLLTTYWVKIAIIIVSTAGMGLAVGVLQVIFGAALMRQVNPDYMARVSATASAVLISAMPVGSFILAGLAEVLPISTVLLWSAIIAAVLYLALIKVKILRKL